MQNVDNISLYQSAFVVSTALRCYIAGRFHHSFYPYTFAYNVVFALSDLQVFILGLDQCFASTYRFSASLKLITFQMALRYCQAISNELKLDNIR